MPERNQPTQKYSTPLMLAACTVAPWVDPDHALRELPWTAEGKSCSASYVAPRSDFGDTHTPRSASRYLKRRRFRLK